VCCLLPQDSNGECRSCRWIWVGIDAEVDHTLPILNVLPLYHRPLLKVAVCIGLIKAGPAAWSAGGFHPAFGERWAGWAGLQRGGS